ncbi:MAG TPA: hypothetical protein VLZ77_10800 [Acidimicrobiales bacterium]|nr:hypothetical protein [Acidimicrobiales bacterium]
MTGAAGAASRRGRARRGAWMAALAVVGAALPGVFHPARADTPLFTPGDVVVYRVGDGAALSSAAAPVYLDEYTPDGTLAQSVALPTTASGSDKPLVASGSASSEGELTLSADGRFLMATGYDTSVGTTGVSASSASSVPRTVARVDAAGDVDTTTALDDFADGNNPRSASSSDGTDIWVGGAAGGVRHTTLGASNSTQITSSADKNVRAVSIVDGQLYVSADPTKAGVTVGTVGSGLPTSGSFTVSNLPFASAPGEPYQYALLTLGAGTSPDTVYVADNSASAIEKYSLIGSTWSAEGDISVPGITGLTANDDDGTVVLFATSSGSSGEQGTLYEATDTSGAGATMSGSADVLASSASEAFRGVAFAPGTSIGSGGSGGSGGGGSGGPTITTADSVLANAIGDPTNPGLGVTVGDASYTPSQLTVSATSSNQSVAPDSGIQVSGSGADRVLTVTPDGVGDSIIRLTVTAPDATSATTTVGYGASADDGDTSDRYYAGAGNGSTEIDVGDGYMVVGDDLSNVLRLYDESRSGTPVKTFDFTGDLPSGAATLDIESAAESDGVIYWLGSMSNSDSGASRPSTDTLFATRVTGSGAGTSLTYLGSYTHLREDLVAWDTANGNPLGLSASSIGDSKTTSGLNVEGLEFVAGSSTSAYLAFRAPIEPPSDRTDALLVPVTNLTSLTADGNPGTSPATFGTPIEWDLGGDGIREIRKNADDQYLVISGSADGSDSSFGLYAWDGDPADPPVRTTTSVPPVEAGAWEGIVSVPDPLAEGDSVELVEDNGDTVWYADGFTSKNGLAPDLQKDLGRTFTLSGVGPPSGTPEAPLAVLLPLAGLAGPGAVVLVAWRRRRRAPSVPC